MNIDSIFEGVVIDHIAKGKGMRLYRLLGLENIDCPVALIKNVNSKKLGRKDIIKIDGYIPESLEIIGYVDPEATVNIIKDGKIVEKKSVDMPEKLENVIKCKNPRCITTEEQEIAHIFKLTDKESGTYRCIYCETKAND